MLLKLSPAKWCPFCLGPSELVSRVISPHRGTASLQWRHNGCDGVSNHQPHDCLLNRLFRHRSKKISKLRVTVPLWGEFTGDRWFPAQRNSNAEKVSIWWRHHFAEYGFRLGLHNLALFSICFHKSAVMSLCFISFPPLHTGIILCMYPANKRRRYIVTSSLIVWALTQNDPCFAQNSLGTIWWEWFRLQTWRLNQRILFPGCITNPFW